MPKLNGIELSKKIREISIDTQLVITTSFDDKEYLLEAVNLQLVNYVIKPLTILKLKEVLKLCESHIPDIIDTKKYFSENIYFNTLKKELIKDNAEVSLTLKERQVLELLIKTLIKILRKKLSNSAVETLYGFGYKLNFFDK